MELEASNRKETRKSTNTWKLSNMFLNNPRAKEEVSKEIENIFS